MSEDVRKNCRTQGKYSDKSQYCDDKRPPKSRDKRQKVSPTAKETQEKKFNKRRSDGSKGSNTSLGNEGESPVRYEENSDHSFTQLDSVRKRIEIKTPGKHVLSTTQNGESIILYNPSFIDEGEAADLLDRLISTTNWSEKNIVIHGVEYPQPRLVAWYGPYEYTYSGATLEPADIPDCILAIKKKAEEYLKSNGINVTLNSVLLNLYRHSKDSVSWHSDDEMSMGVCPTIASVSLGDTRRFEMRRKMKYLEDESSDAKEDEYFVHLTHGSLLIMDGSMQSDWQHRVPKEYHDRGIRINLTFRTVYELDNLPPVPDTEPKYQSIDGAIKKSQENKFNYDEDNFPPLSSDTGPVCSSGTANSPNENNQDFSGLSKTSDLIHGSEDEWEIDSLSNGKTPVKTGNKIDRSQEMWDKRSQEEWDASCNNTPVKNKEINSSQELQDICYNKTPVKTDDKINTSQEVWELDSPYNSPLKDDDKIQRSEKVWVTQPYPPLKNDDKIQRSEKVRVSQPYPCNNKSNILNNLNDDRKNVKIDMQSKNLHTYSSNNTINVGENAGKNMNLMMADVQNKNLPAYDHFRFSNDDVMNVDVNAGKNKNFSIKEGHGVSSNSLTNNTEVNAYGGKSKPVQMMVDMQKKNQHSYESSIRSNNAINAEANAGRNKNFIKKETYTGSSKSSINNTQKNFCKVKDEPKSNTGNRWTPNVEAKEFVPINTFSPSYCSAFDSFCLENLLNYNIDVMKSDALLDYSFALRDRVLEKIHEFIRCQDELDILCKLTDGDQTEKNQKIITTRMAAIVAKALKRQQTSPNFRRPFGNSRPSNHGNQSHYSERNHQSQNRSGYHRY